jgi:hypothetical protein
MPKHSSHLVSISLASAQYVGENGSVSNSPRSRAQYHNTRSGLRARGTPAPFRASEPPGKDRRWHPAGMRSDPCHQGRRGGSPRSSPEPKMIRGELRGGRIFAQHRLPLLVVFLGVVRAQLVVAFEGPMCAFTKETRRTQERTMGWLSRCLCVGHSERGRR